MNALIQDDTATLFLVEIIELKWLLAGHGIRVHVEQLQTDPEYARRMLDRAASTSNATLCAAAARLRAAMRLDPG